IVKGHACCDQHAILAGRRQCGAHMAVAQSLQCGAQPVSRIAAAVFGNDQDVGIVPGERVADPRQSGSAALADVPGEEAQAAHSAGALPATCRPLTSAPASGDILRKNGTERSEIAATVINATEKSAALDTGRPPVANIR